MGAHSRCSSTRDGGVHSDVFHGDGLWAPYATPMLKLKMMMLLLLWWGFCLMFHVSTAPSSQECEIMKELGTNVQLMPNHTTPQKSDTYFNRKMKTNRSVPTTLVLTEHLMGLPSICVYVSGSWCFVHWLFWHRRGTPLSVWTLSELLVRQIDCVSSYRNLA